MTQSLLAEALGVEQSTISGWESGRREPASLQVFQDIAKNLDCNPIWLMFGLDEYKLLEEISQLSEDDAMTVKDLVQRLSKR